ncbi:MAG: hypothetical protein WA865_09840 [Spirulinaceae cyanobacterium]
MINYQYLVAGRAIPFAWETVVDFPCLIIVGNTGVGKSTTVNFLIEEGLDFTLLPNRRILTDQFILAPMLAKEGREVKDLDRVERFNYTRCYREEVPSGIAYVLTQLYLDSQQVKPLLIFDGLRGEQEVTYAAQKLPLAKFVCLTAPYLIRLQRLLNRQDAFDLVSEAKDLDSLKELLQPFTFSEKEQLVNLVETGQVTVNELQQKLKIVTTEKLNYNAEITKSALETFVPQKSLFIDSSIHSPQQIAKAIISRFKL